MAGGFQIIFPVCSSRTLVSCLMAKSPSALHRRGEVKSVMRSQARVWFTNGIFTCYKAPGLVSRCQMTGLWSSWCLRNHLGSSWGWRQPIAAVKTKKQILSERMRPKKHWCFSKNIHLCRLPASDEHYWSQSGWPHPKRGRKRGEKNQKYDKKFRIMEEECLNGFTCYLKIVTIPNTNNFFRYIN